MEATPRVTGIGGIFIRARDPDTLRAWYQRHLGIDVQAWGGTAFRWRDDPTAATADGQAAAEGTTVWSIFAAESPYFPGAFMVNYRVADLDGLLNALRAEGCEVDEKTDQSDFGKFGWVADPEGNRVELWEPPRPATSG